MSAQAITLLSIYVGLVGYAALTLFFVVGLLRRITGRAALVAAVVTTAWYASLARFGPAPISDILELSSYLMWILFLARILGVSLKGLRDENYLWQSRLVIGATAVFIAGIALAVWGSVVAANAVYVPLAKLLLCLLGLVIVEQVARNTRRDFSWQLKFMTLGLGTVFGYGFILHADTVLFGGLSHTLFTPQGFVYALAIPMIALASLRNRDHQLNFNVSRQFIFRSGVLIITGGYLVIVGAAGYYVRLFGGQWGAVFMVLLLVSGAIGLIILALSTHVRSALRVALKRNLYEYKYDYREEWLRVSAELTEFNRDDSLEARAIHAVGELVHCAGGAILRITDQDVLVPTGQVNADWAAPLSAATSSALKEFFAQREWIVDLDGYREDPTDYAELDLSADAAALASARFLVPLSIGGQLFGVLVLSQPSVSISLDWEDYDILKIVARQATGFLALKQADEALSTSAQFRVRDELSAFVVHDLKTISAQLSLMRGNAERHRDNPAFIDDLLKTVDNAVDRMGHLLAQLRHPTRASAHSKTELLTLVKSVIEDRTGQLPKPTLTVPSGELAVLAEPGQLRSAIGHLVQNAQEATPDDGRVDVAVTSKGPWIHIVITDTGEGMTEAFLHERLFSPFTTSKGVAGVGIGAYQAREIIRSFGGDLAVSSSIGKGSTFTVRLPRGAPIANESRKAS